MPLLLRPRSAAAPLCAALLLLSLAFAARADAATRTWISGVGDDANPCSRTAPCKTIAGAISKTDVGGEIDALDPAGYGAVTITKAITIDFSNTLGSILNPAFNGIIVNAPGANVVLRGIAINGLDSGSGACAGAGLVGIKVIEADTVRVEHSQISSQGQAISIVPAAGDPKVFVSDSALNNNCVNGIKAAPAGGHKVALTVTGTSIFNSGTALSAGDGVASWLQGSTITGNALGLETVGSGTIDSFADNVFAGNGDDGRPTVQRTIKGDTGATGTAGAAGAAGAVGPTGAIGATGPPAFKLVVAPVSSSLRSKAGARVKLKYVATTAARATLTVTKGTKKVAAVAGATVSGANTITWNGKAAKGKRAAAGVYRLALRVVGTDGQVATAAATLRLTR
jgi:hypothetical protein